MTESKKEQILRAASDCFARFGYKKTTLDDIGKLIGLNKASIYHYFSSKEEIFTTIVLNEFNQFIGDLQQEIIEHEDCEERLLIYFVKKIGFWSQNSTLLPQITEVDPEKLPHLMRSGVEIYQKIEAGEKKFLADILESCIKDGHFNDVDKFKTGEYMIALADGVKDRHLGFDRTRQLSQEEYETMIDDIRQALKIFVAGLSTNIEGAQVD